MKILMLGWELPPHNSGGLGVACYQLCKSLAHKGMDIEFLLPYTAHHDVSFMKITPAHMQGVKEILRSGIAYDSYKYIMNDGTEKWLDIYAQQAMYEESVGRLVDEMTFDVIHAHDWLTFRAALRAQEKTGRPLIVHVHSIESDRAGGKHGNPLVHDIEYTAFMLADRIVAVSELTRQAIMRDYKIPGDKIEVVHNSIDPDLVEPLDDDNAYAYLVKMKEHGFRVVSNVGRLTVQKGLTHFLHAAREVVNQLPKTIFLIVGSGEQYRELLELSARLGIGQNVVFTGFQRGKLWRDAYAVSDLFVMPSVSEPFGIAPLEAIGYGTPVLISKQSGVAEVLHHSLKVDFWDVHEMANQITAALRSDAFREVLHANALSDYSSMSWHRSADKLIDLYRHHHHHRLLVGSTA